MIDPALLDRLQKADPETWHIFDSKIVGSVVCHDGCDFVDVDICRIRLTDSVQEAWLQAVLQDAIRAKGWLGIVLFDEDGSRSVLMVQTEDTGAEISCQNRLAIRPPTHS